MSRYLIVSRHPAAVEFIKTNAPEFKDAPVLASAVRADVIGAVVAGNLPLHLAALAVQVVAVEFTGDPPRGAEYGQTEMIAAGARLTRYTVCSVATVATELEWNDGIGHRGRQSKLLIGAGDAIHEFSGSHISGVVAVLKADYKKNGKWSNTDYRLKLSQTAWSYVAKQSWEEGEWFHGCSSVAAVVAEIRKAGCIAADATVRNFLVEKFPKTMERIVATESALASV
jgi:hypothetical protein